MESKGMKNPKKSSLEWWGCRERRESVIFFNVFSPYAVDLETDSE